MEIGNKTLIIIIIITVMLIWYVRNSKSDVSRYKNIIDKYMTENNTEKKSTLKKVRFDIDK